MIKVRPILTVEEFNQVVAAAAKDKHGALCPSHYIEKEGHVVGCFALNTIPFSYCWFSTTELAPRETFEAVMTAEAIIEHMRLPVLLVPCLKDSPLFPYMEKLGYENRGEVVLFLKEFNKKGI